MILIPPTRRTMENLLALVPEDWSWLVTKCHPQGEGYFCHIMTPEFENRLVRVGTEDSPENAQKLASFRGYGETPVDAILAAFQKMEEV